MLTGFAEKALNFLVNGDTSAESDQATNNRHSSSDGGWEVGQRGCGGVDGGRLGHSRRGEGSCNDSEQGELFH